MDTVLVPTKRQLLHAKAMLNRAQVTEQRATPVTVVSSFGLTNGSRRHDKIRTMDRHTSDYPAGDFRLRVVDKRSLIGSPEAVGGDAAGGDAPCGRHG